MWASVYDCAIVLIGHLNKKEGTKGLYRSLGSIDVVAAARSVLQVERDSEDANIRIFRHSRDGYLLESMRMRALAAHLWNTEKGCSS